MREECCTCTDRLNYVKLCEKYDQLESIHEVLVEDNLTYENQIADLEAKLAESKKEIKEWIAVRDDKNNVINKQTEKINELKQQLEEYKQSLKETIDHYEKYCSEINHQNIMLYAAACNAQQASQDKISFAVYELSLVNGMLTDAIIELTQNETDANKLYYLEKIAKKFAEKTGGRINELKEMK